MTFSIKAMGQNKTLLSVTHPPNMPGILWLWIFFVGFGIEHVQAGQLGHFTDPPVACARNRNYTNILSGMGCFGFSPKKTTWEFARDRCRDDGGSLAIFQSAAEYLRAIKTIADGRNPMYAPGLRSYDTNFSFVGWNEDGAINVTAAPESVMPGIANPYDASPSLLGDSNTHRSTYRCGVLPHTNYTNSYGSWRDQNFGDVVDPATNITWPYQPSPNLNYCPKNATDSPVYAYICRLPGLADQNTCICTKWKEPGVRNFKGDYFSLPDQTEYTMVVSATYQISISLWRTSKRTWPDLDRYTPDLGTLVDIVRVDYGGKKFDLTNRNATANVTLYLNGVVAAALGTGQTTVGGLTVTTLKTAGGWRAMALYLPDGTRILYDGKNVEIMTVNGVGNSLSKGLCGTCNPTQVGNPLPDGRLTTRKTLLAASWVSPRANWVSQPPAIATCKSETAKRAAADRCRPLIDTAGVFGACLAANQAFASFYSVLSYRNCVSKVCTAGPAAACPFFKLLANNCGTLATNYSQAVACSDNIVCPQDKPYNLSANGICYHVSDEEFYWDRAYRYCHSINAQLVSFVDGDDIDFIKCKLTDALLAEITDASKQYLWLGGVKDLQNQRHWTDGRSLSYENWDDEDDATADDTARCVAYDLNTQQWVLRSCRTDEFRAFCYVYSVTNDTCSGLPCPPPKRCVQGECVLGPTAVNACDPNPCQNNGQCFSQNFFGAGFMCVCQKDFYGSRCERSINGTSTRLDFDLRLDPSTNNTLAQAPKRRYPPGACWVKGQNADYLHSSEPLAWELAREKCRSYGGRLNSLDLYEDRMNFGPEAAHSAYFARDGLYLRDGVESNASQRTSGCDYWSASCDVSDTPLCSMATSDGAADPVNCPIDNAQESRQPYVCKRHAKTCLCSKWLEPTFRTFNGEEVPVEDNTAYVLFSTKNFSVAAVMNEQSMLGDFDKGRYIFGEQYAPDRWPHVARVIITFQLPNSTNQTRCINHHRMTNSAGGVNDDYFYSGGTGPKYTTYFDCKPSKPPTTLIKSNYLEAEQSVDTNGIHIGLVDASSSYGFTLIYDGNNLELSVNLSIAATSKPGNGLCGSCDDQLRDRVFSSSQIEVENKRVAARSWVLSEDIWPSTGRRVPTITTPTLSEAALRLCYPMYFGFFMNNPSGMAENITNRYLKSCLKNVGLFGPSGGCESAIKIQTGVNLDVCPRLTTDVCSFPNNQYGRTKESAYCQYQVLEDDRCPFGKCDKYWAEEVCQKRGMTVASMDTKIFNNDGTSNYWVDKVADFDNLILFWENGTDVSADDLRDPLVSDHVCVNYGPAAATSNDLDCVEPNKVVCSMASGFCGSSPCYPPKWCDDKTQKCYDPIQKTWPKY